LDDPRVTFVRADIADAEAMTRLFAEHQPAAVLNLAAETHVDRSIDSPRPFVDTNIVARSSCSRRRGAYVTSVSGSLARASSGSCT
jgi:dTDP-glucose 4,6-dehydratase